MLRMSYFPLALKGLHVLDINMFFSPALKPMEGDEASNLPLPIYPLNSHCPLAKGPVPRALANSPISGHFKKSLAWRVSAAAQAEDHTARNIPSPLQSFDHLGGTRTLRKRKRQSSRGTSSDRFEFFEQGSLCFPVLVVLIITFLAHER